MDIHYAEAGVMQAGVMDDPDLPGLIRDYEDAEEVQRPAREKAERDRDYVDNKQLTDAEVAALRKRGQPPIALNVLRDRAAFLAGMEKKQRRDPKAYPRNNPEDVGTAEAFTDGMRYVIEAADYASKRSQAWRNIIIEGFGGVELAAVQKGGRWEFTISRIPWDRAFFDPHSSEPDFTDARYLGQVAWMDYDEALDRALASGAIDEAEARRILDAALAGAPGAGRTYDDKPKTVWADRKRKRVRIVMIWRRERGSWVYREFTKSGVLAKADGPYVDQDGESWCPWFFESANVDRENNRYGEMRHLIDPQDEVNKRRSKALHLLNTSGVVASEGAVKDVNATRRELAKPDFYVEINPGAERFEIVKGADLAGGQAQLAAQAMEYIQQSGPNGAMLGQGVSDQSGRAIEAQQAGGLVSASDLMDTLRRLDQRVFRGIALLMKQFWDAEMWVRVTDNDEAPRYVGLNQPMWTDPATGESAPESAWRQRIDQGQPVGQLMPAMHEDGSPMRANDVSRLDMDIIVSDAPDTINLDGEHYSAFMDLIGRGLPPPALKLAIEMHPGLPAKRKKQFTDMIDQMAQAPPSPGDIEAMRRRTDMEEAKIGEVRSRTYSNLTAGEERMARIAAPVTGLPLPDVTAAMQDAPPAQPPGMPPGMGAGPPEPPMGGPGSHPLPMPPPGPQGPPAPPPEAAGLGPVAMPRMVA